jgi:transposase
MLANALRVQFAEFGIVAVAGKQGLQSLIARAKGSADPEVPAEARLGIAMLAEQWEALSAGIEALGLEIMRGVRESEAARRLTAIPGVGPITASALTASIGDARLFRTGRGFAAWLGLTPRQMGTGGKQRSGPISKQGGHALRTLLVNGASAPMRQEARRGEAGDPWLAG